MNSLFEDLECQFAFGPYKVVAFRVQDGIVLCQLDGGTPYCKTGPCCTPEALQVPSPSIPLQDGLRCSEILPGPCFWTD